MKKRLKLFAFTPFLPDLSGGAKASFKILGMLSSNKDIFIFSYKNYKKFEPNMKFYSIPYSDVNIKNPLLYILRGFIYLLYSTIRGVTLGIIFNPDIIYGKHISTPSVAAAIVAKILRKPLILHTAGSDVQGLPRARFSNNLDFIIYYLMKNIQYICLSSADTIIANSRIDCLSVQKMGLSNVRMIYNGVNTACFAPNFSKREIMRRKLNLSNNCVISYCGSLIREKNIERLVEISKLYPQFKFLFIGPTQTELNAYSRSSIGPNCIAVGKKQNVEEYLLASDIYIHTSLIEGLSNSILEAMACGLPVITSPSGDCSYFIKNNENGFIANDLKEFIAYIDVLSQNSNLREYIGQNARKTIVDNFNWEKTVDQINDIIICHVPSKNLD